MKLYSEILIQKVYGGAQDSALLESLYRTIHFEYLHVCQYTVYPMSYNTSLKSSIQYYLCVVQRRPKLTDAAEAS